MRKIVGVQVETALAVLPGSSCSCPVFGGNHGSPARQLSQGEGRGDKDAESLDKKDKAHTREYNIGNLRR